MQIHRYIKKLGNNAEKAKGPLFEIIKQNKNKITLVPIPAYYECVAN